MKERDRERGTEREGERERSEREKEREGERERGKGNTPVSGHLRQFVWTGSTIPMTVWFGRLCKLSVKESRALRQY